MSTLLVGLALVFFAWAMYRFATVTQAAVLHPDDEVEAGDEAELAELISRKRLALFNIKEMELDFVTGKIGEEDYRAVRRGAEVEAIELMQALDEQRKKIGYAERIESELQAKASELAQAPVDALTTGAGPAPDVLVEDDALAPRSAAAEARQRLREQRELVRCGQCGATIGVDDKFCRECGTPRVASEAPAPAEAESSAPS